ncbi:AraC family transcriptional regulator [Caulobacter mirabilis]|uniref:HTH araC/xylS-type domain-containing protein n=1 Tax=Caulobacter mirabilis TaxID=69666 RepID=A0A2D2AVR7_9CAUL|nr:AraC family transcriptional regulator [Caulobacter mirabilis]ATQ42098.1 hypothetical protein CSW64_06540 [Caulobacter mirabilis]
MPADTADAAIRAVVEKAGLVETLETVPLRHGLLHQSAQVLDAPQQYSAPLPPGLHLSCGIARLRSAHPRLGDFRFDGLGLTAILYEDEPEPFETRIDKGPALSCGLYLTRAQLDDAAPEGLGDIAVRLAAGSRLRATDRPPATVVASLCRPVDPWFQGAARRLAMEARALELAAMTLNWLSLSAQPDSRPALQTRRAERAREILEANLADPPDLTRLAREVGVNVRSLTQAFRLTFDASIAAYVTRRRLETAHGLLVEGMGVAAAAGRVGYSPAHFSTAFLRHYGYRPTDLRPH